MTKSQTFGTPVQGKKEPVKDYSLKNCTNTNSIANIGFSNTQRFTTIAFSGKKSILG